MIKAIKKLCCKTNSVFSHSANDIWDAERVVHTILTIGVGNFRNNRKYALPLSEDDTTSKSSKEYYYLRLLSALRTFKGELGWDKFTDDELISHMVSENFSESKKKQVLELLDDLGPHSKNKIATVDIFNIWGRNDMIKMLLEFIYSARAFNEVWSKYIEFSASGSVIYDFVRNSSVKNLNEPLEKAFSIICLLLGDDYDNPISTSELKRHYDYPENSDKQLGEMSYDEEYS